MRRATAITLRRNLGCKGVRKPTNNGGRGVPNWKQHEVGARLWAGREGEHPDRTLTAIPYPPPPVGPRRPWGRLLLLAGVFAGFLLGTTLGLLAVGLAALFLVMALAFVPPPHGPGTGTCLGLLGRLGFPGRGGGQKDTGKRGQSATPYSKHRVETSSPIARILSGARPFPEGPCRGPDEVPAQPPVPPLHPVERAGRRSAHKPKNHVFFLSLSSICRPSGSGMTRNLETAHCRRAVPGSLIPPHHFPKRQVRSSGPPPPPPPARSWFVTLLLILRTSSPDDPISPCRVWADPAGVRAPGGTGGWRRAPSVLTGLFLTETVAHDPDP